MTEPMTAPRLTLETADERELWQAVFVPEFAGLCATMGGDHEPEQLTADAGAFADAAVLAYRERCAPEPSAGTEVKDPVIVRHFADRDERSIWRSVVELGFSPALAWEGVQAYRDGCATAPSDGAETEGPVIVRHFGRLRGPTEGASPTARWWVDTGKSFYEVQDEHAARIAASDAITDATPVGIDNKWPEHVEEIAWGYTIAVGWAEDVRDETDQIDWMLSCERPPAGGASPEAREPRVDVEAAMLCAECRRVVEAIIGDTPIDPTPETCSLGYPLPPTGWELCDAGDPAERWYCQEVDDGGVLTGRTTEVWQAPLDAVSEARDMAGPAPEPSSGPPTGPGWAEVWLDGDWRDVWVDEGEPDETGGVGLCWLNSKDGEIHRVHSRPHGTPGPRPLRAPLPLAAARPLPRGSPRTPG